MAVQLAASMASVERSRAFLAGLGPAHPAVSYSPVEAAFGCSAPDVPADVDLSDPLAVLAVRRAEVRDQGRGASGGR